MRTSPALTILAVLAAAGLLAGCTQGSNKSSSSELAVAPGYSNGGGAASGAASGTAAPDAATSGGTSKSSGSDSSGTAVSLTSTALIKIADLTVLTKDVSTQATRAVQIATSVGGGVTGDVRSPADAGSGDRSGDNARADLTLAVPPASLDPVLAQLAGLGTEQSRHTSTQDVAGQVADVNSRVSSAQASITRLQLLFSKAANVTEIVALERELSQREADLESLQAQQRTLANQTATATINLHLSSATAVAPPAKHDRGGFLGGLGRGWDAFTSTSAWVFTAVGAGLPFLVLLALLALGALGIRRRIRRSGTPTLSTEPVASGPGVGE